MRGSGLQELIPAVEVPGTLGMQIALCLRLSGSHANQFTNGGGRMQAAVTWSVIPVAGMAPSGHSSFLEQLVEDIFTGRTDAGPDVEGLSGGEHVHLEIRLQKACEAFSGGDFEAGSKALASFGARLGRQLLVEEKVIFPTLDGLGRSSAERPTWLLRMEHLQMVLLLCDANRLLADTRSPVHVLEKLGDLLEAHRAKEEILLCSLLAKAESASAIRRLAGSMEVCLAW
jgi:hemerythrin HHE cation binding domain-containing protein